MTAPTANQSPSFAEIEGVRALSAKLANGLRNQQILLQRRDLSLDAELVNNATAVEGALSTLEKYLLNDETELEQLRTLTETSALINSSLDPDAILAEAMDEIINLTDAERGYIIFGSSIDAHCNSETPP